MDRTDREVLELCKAWFEDIMERSERLTSGNVSHGSRAIHGTAKSYAEFVDEHLKNRWMPSEEQMEALANALSLAKNCGEESSFDLRTLYEQLQKLRG